MRRTKTGWFSTVLFLASSVAAASACNGDDDGGADPAQTPLDGGATPVDGALPRGDDATVNVEGARDAATGASDADARAGSGEGSTETTSDAGTSSTAACTVSNQAARCNTRSVESVGAAGDLRRVYWARPTQAAPASGYPAVILYQGSFFGPAVTWDLDIAANTAFGGYHQVRVVSALLEKGFVVIQPEAQGGTFWSTNFGGDFTSSRDGVFIPLLLAKLSEGAFGPLDNSRLYATGMSSGGYMTSRMAVSFAGRFKALAVNAGAYATCAGPLCSVPAQLPEDHPPTMFLHGTADLTVPISTARDYEAKLRARGIETKWVEEAGIGHAWLAAAPDAIADWFSKH